MKYLTDLGKTIWLLKITSSTKTVGAQTKLLILPVCLFSILKSITDAWMQNLSSVVGMHVQPRVSSLWLIILSLSPLHAIPHLFMPPKSKIPCPLLIALVPSPLLCPYTMTLIFTKGRYGFIMEARIFSGFTVRAQGHCWSGDSPISAPAR